MKILLAVDDSTYSQAAADEVAKRIWPGGSEIKIMSVVEPAFFTAPLPALTPYTASDAVEDARARVEKGATKNLIITTETPEGSAKQIIVEEAEKWGADLIVLGSHGYGFWERVLLGSVSQAVIHHAPCSVEVVRVRK